MKLPGPLRRRMLRRRADKWQTELREIVVFSGETEWLTAFDACVSMARSNIKDPYTRTLALQQLFVPYARAFEAHLDTVARVQQAPWN